MHNWHNDADVAAEFVATDPVFPKPLAWAERVPGLRTVIRVPFYWSNLWRAIGRADIAHIFSASYFSFVLAPTPAWIIARLRGKKTILNYRSGEAADHLQRSAIARSLLRKMDQLVVPSGYLHDVFHRFGIDSEVVPNIVDVTQLRYRERNPLRPILLCNRGCEPYYAVDDVVRAFGHVQSVVPEARLLLVGGGSREQQIRQLVGELRLRNVEFVGKVPRWRIAMYYDQADIFINASYLDNMPVSILEAFAAGTPVVSTAPDGIRYVVEHGRTGLLCEPHDWRALAENVLTLLRNPELASMLARNAHRQSALYAWDRVRQQWLDLYKSTVGRDKPIAAQDSGVLTPKSLSVEAK
jgi:glycosyltransferase involved in cell wall biosynthesis